MEIKLAALKLLLDALGIGTDISSKDRRLKVQKSVYLLQARGVKLGYSFSWYINGPYSTSLTRDYYDMRGVDDAAGAGRKLNDQVLQIVNEFRGIMNVPAGVGLSQSAWLELLASVHYLRCELRKNPERAKAVIREQKAHLLPFYDAAEGVLQTYSLL